MTANMEDIVAKLDQLSEVQAAVDVTRLDYEAKRAEILKAVQTELADLQAEYRPLLDAAGTRVEELQSQIRADVAAHGASVRGAHLQAVYHRGRIRWDRRRLERYARQHPEVAEFRRQGEPSVSLRVNRT